MTPLARTISRTALHSAVRMPRFAADLLYGEPPTNDRGHSLDHQTHVLSCILDRVEDVPIEEMPLADARAQYDEFTPLFFTDPPDIDRVFDDRLPGPSQPIPVRVYAPDTTASPAVIIYYHGGGFVLGGLDAYDPLCRRVADQTDAVVISVDYRLAPEHPFPAAVEDGTAALRGVIDDAKNWNLDPDSICVAGDSAGAAIAAVATQRQILDDQRRPDAECLIYPTVDQRGDYPSRRAFRDGTFLSPSMMKWFGNAYLSDDVDPRDPRIAPIYFDHLEHSPPTLIATAGFDPLRDEGEAFADELRANDVEVIHRHYPGLTHGFVTLQGLLDTATRAFDEITTDFRTLVRAN